MLIDGAPVDADGRRCSRHGNDDSGSAQPQDRSAAGRLQHRGVFRIADETVREPRGRSVEEARRRHAEMGEPGSAGVLHSCQQAAIHHLEDGRHARRDETHPRAGSDQRRGLPGGVEDDGIGRPQQVPATGTRPRVDGAVAIGDRHRTGRHPGRGLLRRAIRSAGSRPDR